MIKFFVKKFLYAQSIIEYFKYYELGMIMPKEESEDLNKSTEIVYKWLIEAFKEYLHITIRFRYAKKYNRV